MRNFRPETSVTQYRIVEFHWTEIQRIWMQRRVLLTYCGQTPTMKSRWKSTKGTRRVINTGSNNLGQMQFLRQLREQTEKMFTVTWNRNFHRKSAALLCLCNGAVLAKFNLSLDFFWSRCSCPKLKIHITLKITHSLSCGGRKAAKTHGVMDNIVPNQSKKVYIPGNKFTTNFSNWKGGNLASIQTGSVVCLSRKLLQLRPLRLPPNVAQFNLAVDNV